MRSEPGKVVARRFMARIAESGLLVLAVALGVGASSSGFSLLANALGSGKDMLSSPGYRELIVSARSSAEEMSAPAVKKPATSNVALTSADLDAAALAPAVAWAYVRNRDDIRFLNAASVDRESAMAASFGGPPGGTPAAGATTRDAPARVTADDLEKARTEADLVIVEFEELSGFRVTPAFFDAWNLEAVHGSLLADGDAEGDANALVLGWDAAAKIAGTPSGVAGLQGKKLLSREGKLQVVGILSPTGNATLDESFFAPYRTYAASGASGGPPRMWAFNTELRFAVTDPSSLDETERLLSTWFDSRFGEGQVSISNPRNEAAKLIARNSGIGLLILFLALSGLFIALVNVSHILMSRGLRMRKGVGIMMALGAPKSSVMGLFASEATAVAVAGSLLGGVFALPLSRSMQSALGLAGGSWIYVLVGVALSWILTMACSIAPAWQNSRIVPADAMRAA